MKIIHVDMDQFFAAVEQRDNPELKDKPIAVGHDAERGVVSTASYEARRFGVHSAQSIQVAKRLCPQLIIVEPHFQRYKEVSAQIHEILLFQLGSYWVVYWVDPVGQAVAKLVPWNVLTHMFETVGLLLSTNPENVVHGINPDKLVSPLNVLLNICSAGVVISANNPAGIDVKLVQPEKVS